MIDFLTIDRMGLEIWWKYYSEVSLTFFTPLTVHNMMTKCDHDLIKNSKNLYLGASFPVIEDMFSYFQFSPHSKHGGCIVEETNELHCMSFYTFFVCIGNSIFDLRLELLTDFAKKRLKIA